MKRIRVGLLGFGTVGAGVFHALRSQEEIILRRTGAVFDIRSILVQNAAKERPAEVKPLITTDFRRVLKEEIQVVVEAIGGIEPARTYVEQAIEAGCHIVTANKELVAKHGVELERMARRNGVHFFYEASVGGGIPVLGTLIHFLKSNRIHRVSGILNGTTNYILTRMAEEAAPFEQVLEEARQKGYAEADPSADVDGFDAVYKLVILGRLAFEADISVSDVQREGIRDVTAVELAMARRLGYTVKLLAVGEQYGENGPISLGVEPALLPLPHPLASVNGVYNAIHLEGDMVQDVTLVGQGAGEQPTSSAVVEDLCNLSLLPSPMRSLKTEPLILPAAETGGRRFVCLETREHGVPEAKTLKSRLESIGLSVEETTVSPEGGAAFILRRWDPSYPSVLVAELGLDLARISVRRVFGTEAAAKNRSPEVGTAV
ncbi:homoserine dehydrogenase [Melghirimyces profundicolus]|uniref:Homoserine dehydrogenase n=1 Tax=Melghirimyces profundicolus TaxID=1242148 RepID=A0A2T6BC91_9BACL|nr:homoserine dehydrogenase [Melghirimyces profundicolus]PTX53663.1 homoserine dehydrogenase [Melghirimyces profundicolus]